MKNTIIADLFSQNQAIDYVEYEGNKICRIDRIKIPKMGKLRIVWEEIGGDWTQIIQLRDSKELVINGNIAKIFNIWPDENNKEVLLDYESKTGNLSVNNAWEYDDSGVNAWIGSAGMIIEEIPNGRRYRCNDGYPDVDFDDLVFSLYWDTP